MSTRPNWNAQLSLIAYLAIAALNSVDSGITQAQQPAEEVGPKSESQSLVRSILASREALQSGVCFVHEERDYKKKSERDYRFVFDYSKELVRFERDDKVEGKTIYIGTPVDTFVYIPGNGHIDRHAPRRVPILSRAMPFDLRRIGISGSVFLSLPSPWDKYRQRLLTLEADLAKHGPPDRNATTIQIKLISPVAPYQLRDGRTLYNWPRQMFYLDKDKENVVARYELFVRSSFEKDRPEGGTEVLDQTSETKWKEIGDAIVPTECLMINHPQTKMPSKITMKFDWKSVNAPVDMAAFTVESLGAPVGTKILNHESGRPVEQGRIGEKAKVPNL